MATGSFSIARIPKAPAVGFELSYPGKLAPSDILAGPRASLRELSAHGHGNHDNRLIAGDNLLALRVLLDDDSVRGKVRLVYIDPPYATGFVFQSATVGLAYDDGTRGAQYLEQLRERLLILRELLADDGSVFMHLDATMMFPAKLLMDEVFGGQSFRNLITRVKCNPKNQFSKQFGDVCDYLLFYTKSKDYVWNTPVVPWQEGEGEKEYNCVEEGTGRRFKKVPCHLPGIRNGATGSAWKGVLPPPGKHWVHPPARLDELDREGRIYWSPNGNPRRKLYLDESPGKRRSNLWADFRDTQNQNALVTGYPTEKNLEMLRMIVEASSNPDDLVLDAYCGSGTTLAAAGGLGRRWIGIDSSPVAIRTAVNRLLNGTPRMGSYARKTYIMHERGERVPEPDTSFRVFVDTDSELATDFLVASEPSPEVSLCR